jgi:hypothetical protein
VPAHPGGARTPFRRATRSPVAHVRVIATIGALLFLPDPAGAQVCDPVTLPAASWPSPLDRRVTVRGGDVPLRDALERVAAISGIRLSWSDALLALDQRVCLEATDAPLGALLASLTGLFAVAPRVAGPSLVVLAPVPAPSRPPGIGRVSAPPRIASLERVVVTGTLAGGAQRGLSTALAVVTGDVLEARDDDDLSRALDGSVPGVWMWRQAPASVTARYGSVRGASSFGVSMPKVYLDGIEVANPLVVAHLPAESVDQLEVLRGPQGAALYGTDAISGVMHIVTRPPGQVDGGPALRLRAQAGAIGSRFAEPSVFAQEYLLSGRTGSASRAAHGTLSFVRTGAYLPGVESRQWSGSARARQVGSRHVLDGTLRVVAADVAAGSNPLLLDAMRAGLNLPDSLLRVLSAARARRWHDSMATALALDASPQQSVRQLTVGVTGTLHPNARWTHRATLGVDGYTLNGTPEGPSPLPSAADSALRAAEGSALRASARASTTATWRDDRWRRTLTLSTEHALLREATSNGVLALPRGAVGTVTAKGTLSGKPTDGSIGASSTVSPAGARGNLGPTGTLTTGALPATDLSTVWRQTNGVVAQFDADWRERWYLTAGARLERSAGFTDRALLSVLPMAGTALLFDLPSATVKLRAAYGRGIRPPRATIGAGAITRAVVLPNAALEAEQQAGTEVGLDLSAGRHATLQVTRFDQRASGLVQPVTLSLPVPAAPPGLGTTAESDPLRRRLAYQLQNVGAIHNRGWELAVALRGGPVSLQGTYSTVDSRVDAVRRGYTGDLRVGDRVLDVPARTWGATVRLEQGGWDLGLQATRVEDWIGYDRLAAVEAYASSRRPSVEFVGPALRQFWMRYAGVTRLGATVSRALRGNVSLQLRGENLLDVQTGEPDNATILPGRTLTLGVRARF